MSNEAVIDRIVGRGVPVRGNDIDTDRIIPARYLREITFEGLGPHAFEDDRRALNGAHPLDDPTLRGRRRAGGERENFGCGSSREHAPQALLRRGIRAIVGESFAEIFFGNCVTIGLPCLTTTPEHADALQALLEEAPDTELTIDGRGGADRDGPGRLPRRRSRQRPGELPDGPLGRAGATSRKRRRGPRDEHATALPHRIPQ